MARVQEQYIAIGRVVETGEPWMVGPDLFESVSDQVTDVLVSGLVKDTEVTRVPHMAACSLRARAYN